MSAVRILVWGAGFFGRKWIETVTGRGDAVVAGLVSRAPDRLSPLRQELGLAEVPGFASLEDAVAAAAPAAVIVALPQAFHRDAIVRGLAAGLHVLTEKPLATSPEEARAIAEASRRRPDRVVMVSQNFRWRPHVRALGQAVAAGRIGRVGHVSLECRQQVRRTTVEGWRERMADPYLGDFAIHHFDLLRYLTGQEVCEATAVSFRPRWSWFHGNSAAAAILTLESGAVVDYAGTMVARGRETPQEGLITLDGEGGTLHLDGASRVRLLDQGEPRELPPVPIPEGELGHGLAQFLEAIRTGLAPETALADNLESFALLCAVVESARAGRPIRPPAW